MGDKLREYLIGTLRNSYDSGVAAKAAEDAKTANKNRVTTDYGRVSPTTGQFMNNTYVREQAKYLDNQQAFYDEFGTRWTPIGGDMFEGFDSKTGKSVGKRNKFDIAVDNKYPTDLLTGDQPGYTPASTNLDPDTDTGGELVLGDYFKDKAQLPIRAEEQFRDKLGADYPELRVDSPVDTDYEMITVNGEEFYLDGGPDSNPAAEMKRLQKILDEVEKARKEGTEYNPDEDIESEEGEKGLGDTTEKPFPRKAKKGEEVKGKYYVIDGIMYQWNGKKYITVKGN